MIRAALLVSLLFCGCAIDRTVGVRAARLPLLPAFPVRPHTSSVQQPSHFLALRCRARLPACPAEDRQCPPYTAPPPPPAPPTRSALAATTVTDTLTSVVNAQQLGGLQTALAGASTSVYG